MKETAPESIPGIRDEICFIMLLYALWHLGLMVATILMKAMIDERQFVSFAALGSTES